MYLNNDINYIKLNEKAKGCMRVNAAVVCITVALSATAAMILFWDGGGVLRNILIAACYIWAAAYITAVPLVRYDRYRYCIDEEAIRVIEGFIWVSEQTVPIERLQKISRSQGPVARMFGLSTVKVTTAGGDVEIKFLTNDKADEISESLKKKINAIAVFERNRD